MNLTTALNRVYSFAQVIQTPKQSGTPRPKECGFFTSIISFMVGRETNTILDRGISSPDFARFEAPDRQYIADGQLPSKEQSKMSAKIVRAPARRKSRINPKVVAHIVPLSAKRRKKAALDQWSKALKIYLGTLNRNDFNIAQHVIKFIAQKPFSVDTSRSCVVIRFPIKRCAEARQ
jgi:hypothetical protein